MQLFLFLLSSLLACWQTTFALDDNILDEVFGDDNDEDEGKGEVFYQYYYKDEDKAEGEVYYEYYYNDDDQSTIPGEPHVDYPAYTVIPNTQFQCQG